LVINCKLFEYIYIKKNDVIENDAGFRDSLKSDDYFVGSSTVHQSSPIESVGDEEVNEDGKTPLLSPK
jgi:hypothetical protein